MNHVFLLKNFPYIGRPVDERPGVRGIVHTPIVIYYRVNESPNFVEVLHFWHGSRSGPISNSLNTSGSSRVLGSRTSGEVRAGLAASMIQTVDRWSGRSRPHRAQRDRACPRFGLPPPAWQSPLAARLPTRGTTDGFSARIRSVRRDDRSPYFGCAVPRPIQAPLRFPNGRDESSATHTVHGCSPPQIGDPAVKV